MLLFLFVGYWWVCIRTIRLNYDGFDTIRLNGRSWAVCGPTTPAIFILNRAGMKATRINDMYAQNGYIRGDGRMVHDLRLMEVKSPAESRQPLAVSQSRLS